MTTDRPEKLLEMARRLAESTPDFQAVLGAGSGDRSTAAFMKRLRIEAETAFGADYSERRISGETAFAVDFHFPEEGTVVEVALGLPNPLSEFEKDILKAIVAQDFGHDVRRLFFISRAGACKKCFQPGRAAVVNWALEKHGLVIEVHDLPGEPRKRHRRSRAQRSANV